MAYLEEKGVANTIFKFIKNSNNAALFAGAGVGAKTGLPSWRGLMEHLAKVANQHDPLSSELIHQRVEQSHYLSAAAVYMTCPQIPIGEKYEQIASPFKHPPHPEKLKDLVSLPFTAIFTTNYDRSLHNAFAAVTGTSPDVVELGDQTMKRAPFVDEFYIARVHGRAEIPESIILSEDDYRRLEENPCYIDFMRHILTRYSCIFIGFSFLDPAIESVFRTVEDRLSPGFPKLHIALLSSNSDIQLTTRLSNFNIKTIQYKISDKHTILWKGINLASRKYTEEQITKKPQASFPLDTIKRFIATAYTRIKLEEELKPLRDIMVDGIILDILKDTGKKGATLNKIAIDLKRYLSLSNEEIKNILKRRIEVLCGRGLCQVEDNIICLTKDIENLLEKDMEILIEGIINRFRVREGQSVTSQLKKVAKQCIEDVFLARGWDLGAHYAGAVKGEIPNILKTISLSIKKYGTDLTPIQKEALTYAYYDIFQRPEEKESIVLAELGRVAFALNLIIRNPCSTISQHAVLPEKIYFDTSYLMPAIVEGHPFYSFYREVIDRVKKAANAQGMVISVVVVEDFLNEIISHRQIAEREVEEMSLEDPRELEKYILYNGLENVNVFIAGYASWDERIKRKAPFLEFLNHFARYKSEKELAEFLTRIDIKTISLHFKSSKEEGLYNKILISLQTAYESDYLSKYVHKGKILIKHEARQLTQLYLDLENGLRSLFITADMRLNRLAHGDVLEKPGNAIVSHHSFIQLIDILLGLRGDPIATTKLLWGGIAPEEDVLIRNYLISRALRYQDETMTKSMHEVLLDVTIKGADKAKQEGIILFSSSEVHNEVRKKRLLDNIEDDFYANMAEVIDRKYPEEFNYPNKIRQEHLKKNIQVIPELVKKSEKKLDKSDDTKERARLRKEIYELHRYLYDYRKELKEMEQKK